MPKRYDPDTKAEIIAKALALVDDGKSLRQACDEIGFERKTVEYWIDADPELSSQYLRARANRAEKLFEEALIIQDSTPERVIQLGADGQSGTQRIDPAFVAWQSHRVNLRMRMIAKMDPKRYGDKIDIANTHSAPDGGPVQVDVATVDASIKARLESIRNRT